jgi:hypothetical protein
MLQIVIYVALKSSFIVISVLQYKSAATNCMNITDITQQREVHLVKYGLQVNRFEYRTLMSIRP